MAHNHDHHHGDNSNIKLAFILNFLFTIVELIGGLWTNSLAILSDALHDLGDSLSLAVAWGLENYSQKEADRKFTFGYSRFSLLGALINALILLVGSLFIVFQAVPRLLNPQSVRPKGMLVLAGLGIIVNGLAAFRLREGESLNEEVVSWHLWEDVLGWAAVLVVSLVLMVKELPILDPILSIGIAAYILYNVVNKLKQVLTVFLQGVPEDISISAIENKIMENTEAEGVHHTHIWSLEGENNLLSTHVVVDEAAGQEEIIAVKNEVKELMEEENIDHTTIEVEYTAEKCQDKDCE